ncbi:hypothetical protein A6U87_10315 [Rhizobium sp. AC44/96]|uniref:DUF2147 domain-containing protein n=1 Tax=unclassified Rhizobium TaxID=2613769 RepID=UPI0008100923|nr:MULTISPECIES: DUF2147 domain-containing protein [unclassified Rhizobium]MDM9620267.1 DUF2147 domain-containing protein [Rhizobium sp. S96]OCJ09227.1 hypothetical protein A6U87_10315 [Rhizobium sp. AC44/96]
MRPRFGVTLVITLLATDAMSADAVVGTWKTEDGKISVVERCGASYCIFAKSGEYAGQKIGTFSGAADSYSGRITDPRNKTTYSGKLTVLGDSLKLRGCATDVLCKTQTWTRAD